MTDNPAPDGVSSELWAEVQQLSDYVHQLHHRRFFAEGKEGLPPSHRLAFDIPEEWFVLFAWISIRARRQRHGHDDATGLVHWHGLTETTESQSQAVRQYARAFILRSLNDLFHAELHQLCTGSSYWLRPSPPVPPAAPQQSGDLDDDIPF